MRSIYVVLFAALVGLTVSCSAGSVTDLSPADHGKVVSDGPDNGGFDNPDYIFYDGEGGDDIE